MTQKQTLSRYTCLTNFDISASISAKGAFIQHLLGLNTTRNLYHQDKGPGFLGETKAEQDIAIWTCVLWRRVQSISLIKQNKTKQKTLDHSPCTLSTRQAQRNLQAQKGWPSGRITIKSHFCGLEFPLPFQHLQLKQKKKSSNKPATGLLFVAGTEDYASGLLLQFS